MGFKVTNSEKFELILKMLNDSLVQMSAGLVDADYLKKMNKITPIKDEKDKAESEKMDASLDKAIDSINRKKEAVEFAIAQLSIQKALDAELPKESA